MLRVAAAGSEQYGVEWSLALRRVCDLLEGALARFGGDHLEPVPLQAAPRRLAHAPVRVDDEQSPALEPHDVQVRLSARLESRAEAERAAAPGLALDLDAPAHELDELACDCGAEPR